MTTIDQIFDRKIKYLGYSNIGKVTSQDISDMKKILEQIGKYNDYELNKKISMLPSIELEEIIKETIAFYSKYFALHEVYFLPNQKLSSSSDGPSKGKTVIEAFQIYYDLMNKISPFELPIEKVNGHSMEGETQKPLIIAPEGWSPEEKKIPFSQINLGNMLTKLSVSTYAHEIAHTQQESIPGYAEDLLNKEVISIFIEKLSVYESDPTGQLLKISERKRFAHFAKMIKVFIMQNFVTREEVINAMVYIKSTLQAEKLFDTYVRGTNHKREEIILGIQDVFDGKKTVEEILAKQKITFDNSKDLKLVLRHI